VNRHVADEPEATQDHHWRAWTGREPRIRLETLLLPLPAGGSDRYTDSDTASIATS
jgi:hypothetical protein